MLTVRMFVQGRPPVLPAALGGQGRPAEDCGDAGGAGGAGAHHQHGGRHPPPPRRRARQQGGRPAPAQTEGNNPATLTFWIAELHSAIP